MANMKFANNANTTLASSLTAIATTMSVTSATKFPVLTGAEYFYCTLTDVATQTVIEIVKVTATSGTTWTIARGQDGTTGTSFAAGDVVSLRLVRASLDDFPKLDEVNTFTSVQTFSSQPILSSLTASSAVATDASKGLVSVTNTGSGNNVLATSPTITGATLTTAALNGTLGATTPSTVVGTSILSTGGSATVQARLNGSDTFGSGATIGLTNTAADRIWFTQLSASNNYDWWYFNGSTASKLVTINTSGILGIGATPSAFTVKAIDIGSYASVYTRGSYQTAVSNNVYNDGTDKYKTTGYQAAQYLQGDGTHQWYTAGTGTAGAAITLTEAMRIHNSRGVSIGNTTDPGATNLSVTGTGKFGTTVGVGAATPSTSGAGITFPATQSASTEANTLDDYEEGNWTPIPTPGTGSITSYTSTGRYTKIGRTVLCNCFVNITNNGSGATNGYISGLPFATANAGATSCTRDYSATGKIGIVQFLTGAVSGYVIATDGTYPWASGSTFNFSFSYQI